MERAVARDRGAAAPRRRSLLLALAGAALAVAAWWFFTRYLPDLRRREVDRWRGRLVAMAEDRRTSIDHWLADGLADARTLASYPTLRYLLSGASGPTPFPREQGARGHLAELLSEALATHEQRSAVVVAASRVVMRAGDEAAVTDDAAVAAAALAVETGAPRVDVAANGLGRIAVLFVAPVASGAGERPRGAVVLDVDPESFLYPLLRTEPLPTETGETMLARLEGDEVVFLHSTRHGGHGPLSLRLPLRTPRLAMSQALAGGEGFGELLDYRGVPVLAAVERLRRAPWGLVAKVDASEALAPYRRRRLGRLVGALVVIVSASGLAFGLLRTQQAAHVIALHAAQARSEESRRRAEAEVRRLNEELEERVRRRTAELEAANRELEAFSYSVSHDLRAPLRAIDGFARILREDHATALDEEGRRLLDVVRNSARRMGRLIDDLLAFSRAGRQALSQGPVDMGALARTAFETLAEEEPIDGVELQIASLEPVRGDPALLTQVWTNLIGNALKFTSRKPRRVIDIGCRAEPARVEYFVRDNGVGFDMRYADKLFGVFERLHPAHEFEGTGVGLALVQRIVARHGGAVSAEGRVGEGATIRFSLPREGGSD
jgi:signal transduction histidine kinase